MPEILLTPTLIDEIINDMLQERVVSSPQIALLIKSEALNLPGYDIRAAVKNLQSQGLLSPNEASQINKFLDKEIPAKLQGGTDGMAKLISQIEPLPPVPTTPVRATEISTNGSGIPPGDGNNPTPDEALTQTEISNKNKRAIENMYDRTCTIKLRGEPAIQIGDRIKIKGMNPSFDREWSVMGISHTLGTQPFTTDITLFCMVDISNDNLDDVIAEHNQAYNIKRNDIVTHTEMPKGDQPGRSLDMYKK